MALQIQENQKKGIPFNPEKAFGQMMGNFTPNDMMQVAAKLQQSIGKENLEQNAEFVKLAEEMKSAGERVLARNRKMEAAAEQFKTPDEKQKV